MHAAPTSPLKARTQRSLLLAAGLAMTTFAATALGGTFNSMVVFGDRARTRSA